MPRKIAKRHNISSETERTLVVVCYDVADEKRRRLIADTLENYGARVQESVFECYIDAESLTRLCREISVYVDAGEDAVHYYLMCGKDAASVRALGRHDGNTRSGYGVI